MCGNVLIKYPAPMEQEYFVPENVTVVQKTAPIKDVHRVVVHGNVIEIADEVFRDWESLSEIMFTGLSGLKKIGARSFSNTSLKEFTAPETLRSIRAGAFADCKELRTVKLNEGLESIGDGAFQNSGVEEVYIPSDLQKIGENAFAGCKHLRKIALEVDCKTFVVAENSVSGALTVGLKSEATKKIPEPAQNKTEHQKTSETQRDARDDQILQLKQQLQEMTRQKTECEERCKELQMSQQKLLQRVEISDALLRTTSDKKKRLQIEAEKLQRELIAIQERQKEAYSVNKRQQDEMDLMTRQLADGQKQTAAVQHLLEQTAQQKTKLEKQCKEYESQCKQLQASEQSLRQQLNQKDKQLAEICPMKLQLEESRKQVATLQEQLKSIVDAQKQRDQTIATLKIQLQGYDAQLRRITKQPEIKIQMLRNPRALVVPDGTRVVNGHQYEDTNYERVFVPKSVELIGDFAFDCCQSLKEVVIEEGSQLKTIGRGAFLNCYKLAKIDLPEGLEKIGFNAFQDTGLENVKFPASLRMISQGIFCGCKRLRTIRFAEGLEVLGTDEYLDDGGTWCGVFQDSALENVKLPFTLKRIEYNAFKNCKALRHIWLPSSLEYVGKQCFFGSGLLNVQIPKMGVYADENAFDNCPVKDDLRCYYGRVFPKDQ